MLTASEKKWLKGRKIRYARNHLYHRNAFYIWPGYSNHDEIRDLKDALEFSERVAAKLAEFFKIYIKNSVCADLEHGNVCPGWKTCTENLTKTHPPCDFDILKGVRLQVEEEMENELARMS